MDYIEKISTPYAVTESDRERLNIPPDASREEIIEHVGSAAKERIKRWRQVNRPDLPFPPQIESKNVIELTAKRAEHFTEAAELGATAING